MKSRLLVLTDINDGKFAWLERDDIQSLVRLVLYSNEIELEGIIANTSCFVRRLSGKKQMAIFERVMEAYGKVEDNLRVHDPAYPEASVLREACCLGIETYGKREGKGFAHKKYQNNPGVLRIIQTLKKADERPLYVAVWGGANTLAQALWQMELEMGMTGLIPFLKKLQVHSISDQDGAGAWLRERYGAFLSYIVTPSGIGPSTYYRATWPGISADHNGHGSEDGISKGGFTGPDPALVSGDWLAEHIQSHGPLGSVYPDTVYIMEGDTPSWLNLIANGLSDPAHPEYGGWGGRYARYIPAKERFGTVEKYPIWTNTEDRVMGQDGKVHVSPQATIWRWREAMQNDFAARMDWSVTDAYNKANHPPTVRLNHPSHLQGRPGETLQLDGTLSWDSAGQPLSFSWFFYPEAGTSQTVPDILTPHESRTGLVLPQLPAGLERDVLHVILEVTNEGEPPLRTYARVIIEVKRG